MGRSLSRQRSEMHETIRHPNVLSGRLKNLCGFVILIDILESFFVRIIFEVNI
jgi:hypothetical protein